MRTQWLYVLLLAVLGLLDPTFGAPVPCTQNALCSVGALATRDASPMFSNFKPTSKTSAADRITYGQGLHDDGLSQVSHEGARLVAGPEKKTPTVTQGNVNVQPQSAEIVTPVRFGSK